MGKGSESTVVTTESSTACGEHKLFSWDQVKKHNKKEDLWLVINKNVYDLTNFHKKHPGGSKIVTLYGGDDATVCTQLMICNTDV
jgi:cytochrome b involved in lipid metabolism